ncbi:MAG TPA: hypothetical protein VMD02_02955 [Candidatus Omnitrophota bacterium]|nr:hypothetical protein [Candidatus Omnitrophota bacterium]
MTKITGSNGDWRSIQREAMVRTSVPGWLGQARIDTMKSGFTPTATHIETLAKNIGTLGVEVLVRHEPIAAAGLALKLEPVSISRSAAYQALVGIAECGHQGDLIRVSLEDAVALHRKGEPSDVRLLSEIYSTRSVCRQLEQLGAKVVCNLGAQASALAQMNPSQLKAVVLEHSGRLNGRQLSDVLDEWGRIGWPLSHNRAGEYQLKDIIELVA